MSFFFIHHLIDFACRDLCDTSMKSCPVSLTFSVLSGISLKVFLHLRSLCNLWGHYDPKPEKNADALLVTVSFLHIETGEIPQLKALTSGPISS